MMNGGGAQTQKFVIPRKIVTSSHDAQPNATGNGHTTADVVKKKPRIVYDEPSSRSVAEPAKPPASQPKPLATAVAPKSVESHRPKLALNTINHKSRPNLLSISKEQSGYAAFKQNKMALTRTIVNHDTAVKPIDKDRIASGSAQRSKPANGPAKVGEAIGQPKAAVLAQRQTANGPAKVGEVIGKPKAATFAQRDPRQNRSNAAPATSKETTLARTEVSTRAIGLNEPFNYGLGSSCALRPMPTVVDDTPPIRDKELLAKLVLPDFAPGKLACEDSFSYLFPYMCRRFMHDQCSSNNKSCRLVHEWPTAGDFRDKLARITLQEAVSVYEAFMVRAPRMFVLYFNEFLSLFRKQKVDKLYDMVNDCILREPNRLMLIFDALIEIEDGYAKGLRKLVDAVKRYKAASNQLLVDFILSPSNDCVGEFAPFVEALSKQGDHGITYVQANTMLRMCVENDVGQLAPTLANLITGKLRKELSTDLVNKFRQMTKANEADDDASNGRGANGDEANGGEEIVAEMIAEKIESVI